MVNRVQLTGLVQDDPKIIKTAEGREAISFDLLCEFSQKNSQGIWEKHWVAHHVVVSKGHIVDWAKVSLKKGESILVEGNLSYIELKEEQGKFTKIAAIDVGEFGGKIDRLRQEKSEQTESRGPTHRSSIASHPDSKEEMSFACSKRDENE